VCLRIARHPAEYKAYVGAIQQKDLVAQISGVEAFITYYPNSEVKGWALQTLMQDYQQTNNQPKTLEAATRLLAADPSNERALFLLAYFDRLMAQGGAVVPVRVWIAGSKDSHLALRATEPW
jgi:hypothetical protein